ncbi:MAG: phospho-N-acetylmuramoyl-pentapeptide-transferase [Atribacterota bacterium]|nr:phospho-N-acetylmuramoyl-pentapeptide-transferase [Atribacterota bacterium]
MLRIITALLIAFFGPIVMIPHFIRLQKKYNVGQRIRQEGPDLHQHKTGTPTMGGIVIIFSVALSLVFFNPEDSIICVSFMLMCGFGLVGFIDDVIKFYKGRSLGLKARTKIALQLLISILFLYWFFQRGLFAQTIIIPFKSVSSHISAALYIPLSILVFLSTTNAVNLTDGLDGLASGLIIIALLAFALIAFYQDKKNLAIFALIIVLSCTAFLLFNFHPARIFLGDVGSLGLGGVLATIAIFSNAELFLLIIGGIFVLETLSVITQVLSIQLNNKPVFLMSPIHHHFEMMKWKEVRIVIMFWAVGLLFALLGLFAYPFN